MIGHGAPTPCVPAWRSCGEGCLCPTHTHPFPLPLPLPLPHPHPQYGAHTTGLLVPLAMGCACSCCGYRTSFSNPPQPLPQEFYHDRIELAAQRTAGTGVHRVGPATQPAGATRHTMAVRPIVGNSTARAGGKAAARSGTIVTAHSAGAAEGCGKGKGGEEQWWSRFEVQGARLWDVAGGAVKTEFGCALRPDYRR
jgi:hypothetical protein